MAAFPAHRPVVEVMTREQPGTGEADTARSSVYQWVSTAVKLHVHEARLLAVAQLLPAHEPTAVLCIRDAHPAVRPGLRHPCRRNEQGSPRIEFPQYREGHIPEVAPCIVECEQNHRLPAAGLGQAHEFLRCECPIAVLPQEFQITREPLAVHIVEDEYGDAVIETRNAEDKRRVMGSSDARNRASEPVDSG